jgi:hypothetical protein
MIIRVNKEIIKSFKPCADRYENYLKYYSDFNGLLEEFLDLKHISHSDKIWLSLRLMPRFEVECFAIDCALRSHVYAASYASYAAYAAASAAAYAASYASYAASYASYAADAASYASYAADAASYAAAAASNAAEIQNQIESIIYLIQN